VTEQYCRASGNGVTTFFISKTPSNVADVAAPMHMARVKSAIFLKAIIIKILNKKIKK
jgi:hypothetical protein